MMVAAAPESSIARSRPDELAPALIERVTAALRSRYRDHSHYNRKNPLDELLYILCSVKTQENRYRTTHRELRRRFPKFQDLAAASVDAIASAIAAGGLAEQKARAIKGVVDATVARFGKPTLAPLKTWSDEDCEAFLTSFPFIGKKVARCVMMCSLGRKVFPVDVHCWRIAKRLGWAKATRPDGTCSQKDMDSLQNRIPPELRFSLHVNFISLGREICTAASPKCGECPVSACCETGIRHLRVQAVPQEWIPASPEAGDCSSGPDSDGTGNGRPAVAFPRA